MSKTRNSLATLALVVAVAVAGIAIAATAAAAAAAAKPVLITSIGQSAEVSMVKNLAIRAKIPYQEDALADAASLVGADKQPAYSALVAVVGGSAKGLGAAGIDKDQELARTKALLDKAKSLNLKIVVMHVGGEERRGELSDAFIKAVVPYGQHVIIVESGNKDGLFDQLLKGKNVPLVKVQRISETQEPMKAALGL